MKLSTRVPREGQTQRLVLLKTLAPWMLGAALGACQRHQVEAQPAPAPTPEGRPSASLPAPPSSAALVPPHPSSSPIASLSATAPEPSAPPSASASATALKPLVFRGRVLEMSPIPGERSWQVTMQVEQVLEGTFTGARFAFGVHSPTKSRLARGGVYTVRATPSGDGYFVDPMQWNRQP